MDALWWSWLLPRSWPSFSFADIGVNGEIFIKFDTMAGPCRVFTIERKDGLVRVMNVAGTMQSATYLDDDTYCDLPYAYTCDYDSMFFAGVPVRDVLVLGGGGYSYPKHLIAHHPETYVTCVEIDPVITAIGVPILLRGSTFRGI